MTWYWSLPTGLFVFKEGLDLPANRQDIEQGLCIQVKLGIALVAYGLERSIQVMAGDQEQGGAELAYPMHEVGIHLLTVLFGRLGDFLPGFWLETSSVLGE